MLGHRVAAQNVKSLEFTADETIQDAVRVLAGLVAGRPAPRFLAGGARRFIRQIAAWQGFGVQAHVDCAL